MWRVIRLVVWGGEDFAPIGLWAFHYLYTPKIIGLVAPMYTSILHNKVIIL
jgi:hypothetical protein